MVKVVCHIELGQGRYGGTEYIVFHRGSALRAEEDGTVNVFIFLIKRKRKLWLMII
jgi:hypothetical protein